jgi:hypothetical protein
MNIADGMKTITEDIVETHQVRVKALGNLVKEVSESLADARRMIERDAVARKAMSKEQAAELAHFAGDLAAGVGAELKGFQRELELIGKDRVLSAKELKGRLRKEANNLGHSVNKILRDYHKDHAEMSAATRSHLRGFVKDIVKSVEDLTATTHVLMTGYRTDIRKAGNIWSNMTRTLAKVGDKRAALPVIRSEKAVGTVGKAVRKIHKARKTRK